ncbi:hypothetical protein IVA79_17720 [Bradyrhizobium sp. 138]|uniref:hypothetical protein n=1 Tax=Bradyrhizobium sp. 138 TaxID=2782615 RepID=UPI001FF829D7|nr:hypothetical protein [Bradyrhizobium sp. 138]MCK1735732.1 hypothetical protein [Bradyrhizobium sp. 138]
MRVLLQTIEVSLVAAAICLIIGYPTEYLIAAATKDSHGAPRVPCHPLADEPVRAHIGGALFAFLHSFDEGVKTRLISGFSTLRFRSSAYAADSFKCNSGKLRSKRLYRQTAA